MVSASPLPDRGRAQRGAAAQVEDAFIPSDRATGRSRGFAFVTLTNGVCVCACTCGG